MPLNLTEEQIIQLAPDAASVKAGKGLAVPGKWVLLACSERAVWGHCQGSGKNPYQTAIDLNDIAFKCSCPSRKFPCKHGLGLLLLFAAQADLLEKAEEPEWVTAWLAKRGEKAEKKEQKARDEKPVDAAAQAKRQEKRHQNVLNGIEDLETWMKDLVRNGLVNVPERADSLFENMARRMVDAQAQGLAGRLRAIEEISFLGDEWKYELTDRLGKLYTPEMKQMGLEEVSPNKKEKDEAYLLRQLAERVPLRFWMEFFQCPAEQAVTGALNRSSRRRNPRYNEIDWKTTITKNLKNYQPEYKTIIPEIRIGYGRKRKALKDIILCLDQSGSMGTSLIYSGIFGAVLASLPAVNTRMVVFDTAVVDLTDDLQDPVDLLFGVQLGGGTDIARALTYCQEIISRPQDTVLVLVTDLYEGGEVRDMYKRFVELVNSGVQLIVLPALNDDGAPAYDKTHAAFLAELGVPTFACTPDKFPDLMAAALSKQDIGMWVSQNISQ